MRLVKECLRVIWQCQYQLEGTSLTPSLKFWAIENPGTGLLRYFLGKPAFSYQPFEYGENYSKRTALWGHFNEPKRPLLFNPLPPGRDLVSSLTPMNFRNKEELMQARSRCSVKFSEAF